MGLRYRIPFKGGKSSYVVEVYRQDYTGEVKELRGASSCFVVSGDDDDFIYKPIRTSTATIQVLDSDLLLDLYSINNQYAPVKLLKDGVLEWTGYIKPEQFTQPYRPTKQNIGVDCVSALASLENIVYKKIDDSGFVTVWQLLKELISSAAGGYRGVYIPHVYGTSSSLSGNVFERMQLAEANFTTDDRTNLEVLEELCKFLGWTVHDIGGYIYFIDSDWKGSYRLYNESLDTYTVAEGNSVMLQDIGYNGADGNTLDIVPGYNKASVKAVNNVFDEVIKNEDFEDLSPFSEVTYLDGSNYIKKQFVNPKWWEIISYNSNKQVINMNNPPNDPNYDCYGAVAMSLAEYKGKKVDGVMVPDVDEYPYEDAIQMRYLSADGDVVISSSDALPVFRMKGATAVWSEGAISINAQIRLELEYRMIGLVDLGRWEEGSYDGEISKLRAILKIGEWYWDGSVWKKSYTTFVVPFVTDGRVDFNAWVSIKDTKTPDMPYKGLNGYVIPLPESPIIGQLEFTMLSYDWSGWGKNEFDVYGCTMKGLSFDYAKKDGINKEGENGDRVYENVVNEAYMSEADEIEFGISSYNADGATYSKVLLDGDWLTDNLYSAVVGEYVRPEELMIRRIVNRYGATKIKLTEAICMTDAISPLTSLSERSMGGKAFRMTSGEWDYEQNRLIVQMQEDV